MAFWTLSKLSACGVTLYRKPCDFATSMQLTVTKHGIALAWWRLIGA